MEQLDQEEKKILQLLPKGIAQPKPLKELVLHHVPIGAQYNRPNGYYIITNNEERQQALAPLTSQITMMSKRAEIISNAEL
ncbi:hypothetical protein [Limosilactobacillus reuteri]|uniref:hypothetical protein n=1 Tax=Limosilactobacillus reuteri TaxID=1598 RepID=UPI000D9AED57|nr:hypothetical protein [Limosilactobacillus reuteri]PWT49911.1 hypothetical protein DKZ33_07980 [Limosilactobacillus reuteri]